MNRKIFCAGMIFAALGTAFLFAGGSEDDSDMQEERRVFSLSGTGNLSIDYAAAQLTLHAIDGDELVLTERLRNARSAEVVTGSGGLSITGDKRNWTPFNRRRIVADIGIPVSYLGNYQVKMGSGSIQSTGVLVSGGKIEIQVSSGNMALADLTAPEIRLHSSSGSMDARNISGVTDISLSSGQIRIAGLSGTSHTVRSSSGSVRIDKLSGNADIEMQSGNFTAGSIEGGGYRIHSSSGQVRIDSFTGSLDLTSSSGSVRMGIQKLTGNLSFDIKSGGLDLDIPMAEAFNLDSETKSGRVDINDPSGSYQVRDRSSVIRPVGENPAYTITARLSSGHININRI